MKVDLSQLIKQHEKKRLYLGLLAISLVVAAVLSFALWYIIFRPGQSMLNQTLVLAAVAFFSIAVVVAGLGMAGILVTLISSRRPGFFQGPIRIAINIFFPFVLVLGRLFKIDIDRVKRSFIEVNNQMVRTGSFRLNPGQILLLAPHCLQRTECPYKITVDTNNCRRCGKCCIGELLEVRDRYGINIGVATGGTLARKYVKEFKPKGIVAIACERDLTSGIQDSIPLPVLGVTNERPFGPCFNTKIDSTRVEEAIDFFLGKENK